MGTPWDDLQGRLLRAGVAPRHVRRYIRELDEHWNDLRDEGLREGLSTGDAGQRATERLGSVEELLRAMVSQPGVKAWSVRAPWLAFAAGPVLALAAVYAAACGILWSGWNLFLADHATPFVPVHGAAIPYFGMGRLLYFGGPLLVGWGVATVALRQRVYPAWPLSALGLVGVLGALAEVRAQAVATGDLQHPYVLHVGMRLAFAGEQGFAGHTLAYNLVAHTLLHAAVLVLLTALPYGVWERWRSASRRVA